MIEVLRILRTSILSTMAVLVITGTVEQCSKAKDKDEPCTYLATAKDYQGLDGCGMILILDTGEKLLVSNMVDYPSLKDGAQVRIDYVTRDDMMSSCMAEDAIVQVTCLALSTGSGWVVECPKMIDPYRIAWSEQVMQELDPHQVEEMYLDGQRVYRFLGKLENRIYDCTGKLLCQHLRTSRDACGNLIQKATEVKVIYVVNE